MDNNERDSYIKRVQEKTPRWRPIPPEASTNDVSGRMKVLQGVRTFFERQGSGIKVGILFGGIHNLGLE